MDFFVVLLSLFIRSLNDDRLIVEVQFNFKVIDSLFVSVPLGL
ncbi:MAG: hypothetical protein WCG25_06895 [bacterium]